MKLGEILSRQFKKLGIDMTDDAVKALIGADLEVPDEIAGKLDTGLLTIEAAKTNKDVLGTIRQNTLGSADARMDDIIKELGITVGDDFVNEKNTYEKLSILAKAAHSSGLVKGQGKSKEDVSETIKKERADWATKEAELQRKLSETTTQLTNKEKEFTSTRENDLKNFALVKKLLPKDYAFPKDMDKDIVVESALSVINKNLASDGYVLKLSETGGFKITDKDGNPAYTKNHELVDDADKYFDGVLTQHKMLNVNDPSKQQQQQQDHGRTVNTDTTKGNAAVVAEIDAQLFV